MPPDVPTSFHSRAKDLPAFIVVFFSPPTSHFYQ